MLLWLFCGGAFRNVIKVLKSYEKCRKRRTSRRRQLCFSLFVRWSFWVCCSSHRQRSAVIRGPMPSPARPPHVPRPSPGPSSRRPHHPRPSPDRAVGEVHGTSCHWNRAYRTFRYQPTTSKSNNLSLDIEYINSVYMNEIIVSDL